ncbi:MAG: c-type cytochrome [Gammaproteobacteria bacterium]
MRTNKRLLSIFAASLLAQTGSAVAQDEADEGRELYMANQCWQCHGTEGQGGAAVRIAPTVYPFEAFAQFVRHSNLMPAYSPNVLSDDQLRQIFEFVRTMPEPPALDDIPELSGL